MRYHHVAARITDQVAVTEVDQVFFNPNPRQLEGTYLFPIPVGAQIYKFTLDINGQPVEAELLDAEKARRIYEDIVRQARDPALLEYAGRGLFKVRIFPIEPHSEKRIQLRYTQLLLSDGGVVPYLYPLNTEKFSAAPLKTVSLKVEIESRRPIQSVYSPSHPVEIKRHGANRVVVGFESRDARPDTDFQLFFTPAGAADIGLSLLTYNDGAAEGGSFMLLAAPAAEVGADQIVAKDVVFVLDTSGSMADRGKLEQAKRALAFCLRNLNDRDRFEIVRFATEAQPLFQQLAAADAANLRKAEDFVAQLKPTGGTAIEDALLKGLEPARRDGDRDRPYFIVFLTDGLPTVGNRNEDQILASVAKAAGDRAIRIFCFGVGTDVNTHLLDQLAQRTRAASQYVLPNEDLELKVSAFFAKISQPVLANVKLRVGGDVQLTKVHPTELPDLFKGEQLVVFGRYIGHGDAALSLTGTFNGEPRTFTYNARFADRAREHEFIPRLWATRRVGYLLDQIRLHGENRELRDEVTELARRYGIVTPYTAYLIVEDERRRDIPLPARTLQTLEKDERARSEARRMYEEVRVTKSGGAAVGGAQATEALRSADQLEAPAVARGLTLRGQVGEAAAGGQLVEHTLQAQQTRVVRGRTFYQNGAQWVDAQVQSRPDAQRVQVKFGSDEYFDLLTKHPDAAPWLSLGVNVQLVLDETVYDIVE